MVAVKRKQLPEFEAYGSGDEDDPYLDGDDDVFLGFSRVFSGVLRPDSVRPALRCPYPSAPAECASRNLSIPCALALTCLPAQDVYVLGPKYDPGAPNAADNRVRLTGGLKLYLMMGRDLTPMDAAPAGAIVAIGGLERCVTPQLCATVRVGLLTTTPPAFRPSPVPRFSHVLKTATLSSSPMCMHLAGMAFQVRVLVGCGVGC